MYSMYMGTGDGNVGPHEIAQQALHTLRHVPAPLPFKNISQRGEIFPGLLFCSFYGFATRELNWKNSPSQTCDSDGVHVSLIIKPLVWKTVNHGHSIGGLCFLGATSLSL